MNAPARQPVDYLRLSVTDRCNLRCVYCMPPEGVSFKSHWEILSYEEMLFFVEAAAEMGITKIRVTGGEPLVRKGLPEFIGRLRGVPGIQDVALTTNGILLRRFARELKDHGLNRINISLDSLNPERYKELTRGGSLEAVLDGVEAAFENDLQPVKLNVVMMPELLEELADFVALTKERPLHVRFIEWMPVGGCGPRSGNEALDKSRIMKALDAIGDAGIGRLAPVEPPNGWGPAHYFRFAGYAGTIGFIGSVSDHFCGECNRLRLTADGRLKNCLFSSDEMDARQAIRAHDRDGVLAIIRKSIERKTFDRNTLPGRTSRGMSQVGG